MTAIELGDYLRERRGQMSKREAARRAGISETRWRHIEAGTQRVAGADIPITVRPDNVAAASRAVGADVATALDLAGYDPSLYSHLVAEVHISGMAAMKDWFTTLPRTEREAALAELLRLHVDTELDNDTL